jgi:hypothetical protein
VNSRARAVKGGGDSAVGLGRLTRLALEPAISPSLRAELQQLHVDLERFGQPGTVSNYFKPLTTRRLADSQGTAWRRYILGSKLLDMDPSMTAYRQQVESLLLSHGEERLSEHQNLKSYRLQDILAAFDVSVEEAGGLFLDKVGLLLRQPRIPLASDSERPVAKEPFKVEKSDQLQRSVESYDEKVAKVTELDLFSRAAEPRLSPPETLQVTQKSGLEDIQRVVRFLEQMLEQARQFAIDLVAMLEHYLNTARRLASNMQTDRQLAADEQAIDRSLASLAPGKVIDRLGAVPIYLHQGFDQEDTPVATAIIPQLQNQILNDSYQSFWAQLIRIAREQALASERASGLAEQE